MTDVSPNGDGAPALWGLLVTNLAVLLGNVTLGITNWLAARSNSRTTATATTTAAEVAAKATSEAAKADMQEALNSGFASLAEVLRKERADLQSELNEASRERRELRAEVERLSKQNVKLTGAVRGLISHIDGLEKVLAANGIDIPTPRRSMPGLDVVLGMTGATTDEEEAQA